ncbi:MAG: FHA domain-containing protein, partial [SAR324 cluster bacterium]|nr:FHA domain-containing protein [SAR324 cluster bacterium]
FFSMAQEETVVAKHEDSQSGLAPNKVTAKTSEDKDIVLKDAMYWSKASPIVGFLVSYDNEENGEAFELRQGRVIVTSEKAAHGDYFVIADETVSPMHAILRITSTGEVQVLDQLSEFGTKIKRLGFDETEDLSGERSPVGHGDVVWFGKRSFHVCMVVRQRQ